jgi:hypothetical protein
MREMKLLGKHYLRRSKKRFLEGTRARTPFEAVASGARTLEQWADVLNFEREFEIERLGLKPEARENLVGRQPLSIRTRA